MPLVMVAVEFTPSIVAAPRFTGPLKLRALVLVRLGAPLRTTALVIVWPLPVTLKLPPER